MSVCMINTGKEKEIRSVNIWIGIIKVLTLENMKLVFPME